MKLNRVKRIVILLMVFLFSISPALSAGAYTVGPIVYQLPIDSFASSNNSVMENGKLKMNVNGSVGYEIYLPFNSISVQINYESTEAGKLTLAMDTKLYDIPLEAGVQTTTQSFDITERQGDRNITLSSEASLTITSIVFNKENVDTPSAVETILPNLTENEKAIQTAVLVGENSSIIKVNGARRYINIEDASEVPKLVDGKLYLPIQTLARALGYYYEDMPDKGYALLRKDGLEFSLKDSHLFKRVNSSKPEEIMNVIQDISGGKYLQLSYFAEVIGETVGYRDGIIAIDDKQSVNNILHNEVIFDYVKQEFALYVPQASGEQISKIYHVAVTAQASDLNNGNELTPFRTLNKAGEVAQAGDTVIVHAGIYREVFTPKNNGTPTRPIIFKAAENEKVVISATEEVSNFTLYKDNILVADIDWDLGRGRNQLFYKGDAVAEARQPNTDTASRQVPVNSTLSPLWPTQGNIKVVKTNTALLYQSAVSTTDLNQEVDYWKGGTFVSMHGSAWSMGTAEIISSDIGKLEFINRTKQWWFWDTKPTDFGYITGTKNAIDVPGEWNVGDNKVYIYPQVGETAETLKVEVKKRQLVADLENSKYVQMVGIDTIGGGMKMNNSEMCVIDGGTMRYVSHYTDSQDNREGFIEDCNNENPSGTPQRGEMGIYLGGSDNAVVNSHIDFSAAAGIYMVGKYEYIENNIISDCGYMGSYVGGLFMNTEAWKDIDTPRGGHGIFGNTLRNAGRSVFDISVNEKWLLDGLLPPMLPDEVAYNEFYNSGICTRDVGITYVHGVLQGTDKLKTKFHNNIAYDSWASDATNFGIYYDNYCEMIEVYDNIVFYTSPVSKLSKAVYIQTKAQFPTTFAYVNQWNNSILGLRPEGKASLTPTDYPNAKPFRSGSTIGKPEYLENYENIDNDFGYYTVENSIVSEGAEIKDGMAHFSAAGQWVEIKDVDFGETKNQINITFAGDCYYTGDQIEVIVGDSLETGKLFPPTTLTATAPYLAGKNIASIITRNVKGINNVYIRTKIYHSLAIEKISLGEVYINNSYLSQIYAYEFTDSVAGKVIQPTTITGTVINGKTDSVVTNTWGGTMLHYGNVELSGDANAFVFAGSTAAPYSGNVMKVHVGSPTAQPIAEIVITGTSWSDYIAKESLLTQTLPKGIYDIYLTFEKTFTTNFYWFGFQNIPIAPESGTIGNTTIQADNFEGYDEGTTITKDSADKTLGKWTFNITGEGDSVSVAKDPVTNSLALKIVKGSTGAILDATFDFGTTITSDISNKPRVTFDTRFQNHSKNLQEWGTPKDASNASARKLFLSGWNYYRNSVATANMFISSNSLPPFKAKYLTVVQNFNLTAKWVDIKGYDKSAIVIAKGDSTATTSISKLLFSTTTLAAGSGTATDLDTIKNPLNNGIYWIDNVKAETLRDFSYPVTTTKVKDNFEGYAEGTTFNTIGRHSLGNWIFIINNIGDSVKVVKDPITNSLALRLEKSTSTSSLTAYYNIGDVQAASKKQTQFKFDSRLQNHSKKLANFGTISGAGTIPSMCFYKNEYWRTPVVTTERTNNYIANGSTDKYMTVEQTLDMTSALKPYAIKAYDNLGATIGSQTGVNTMTLMNQIIFSATSEADDYQGTDVDLDTTNNPDNNGIYWIDNVSVENLDTPEIKWVSPLSDAQDVATDTGVTIYTKSPLMDTSVVQSNISVYENDVKINNTDYTVGVDSANNNNIKITFTNPLKEGKTYKIGVSGIKTAVGGSMTSAYETSFTTTQKFTVKDTMAKTAFADDKMVYTATLKNNGTSTINYNLSVGMYDGNNELGQIKNISDSIGAGSDKNITLNFDIPLNWTSEYKLKTTVMNQDPVEGPLCQAIETSVPGKRTYGLDVYNNPALPLKVGYIGGSITQQLQYTVPLSTNFFKANQPSRSITYITSGVGGTGSDLGLYRLQKDMMSKKPDIVFIEFAVNDSAIGSIATNTMESMIRQLMAQEHQPVVILLYMPQAGGAYRTSIANYSTLLSKYGIGAVDVGAYIDSKIASDTNPTGQYVWTAGNQVNYPSATPITAEGVHPNAVGGAAYANYIKEQLNSTPSDYFKVMTKVEANESGYINPTLESWNKAIYTGNWQKVDWYFSGGVAKSEAAGDKLTYKFKGKRISLYAPKGITGTSADYVIDDGVGIGMTGTITIKSTVNMPMPLAIKGDLEDKEHTITITVNSNETNAVNFGFANFMIDSGTKVVGTLDKTALVAAIVAATANSATAAVSLDGLDVLPANKWVLQADLTTYTDAITEAQTVATNGNATQAEVTSAVSTLATATGTFNSAQKAGTKVVVTVDKTVLVAAISDAEALIGSKTVGTEVGNVPQVAKDTLQSAVTTASAISIDIAATQADADAQIVALAIATTNFNNAVIVLVTAETVAAGITSVVAPAKDATSLILPIVPEGYTVAVKSATSTIATIAINGTIAPPMEDITVAVVFTITKTSDNTAADTASINVIVPAKTISSEVQGVPGKPVLADDNGQATGLKGGSYNITMNLWWGVNGTQYKLYENGVLIDAKNLTTNSPNSQTAVTFISGKQNGTYKYYCELINDDSTTTSDIITVNVTDALPGKIVLSNDNWDGDGNYKLDMNMWWGTNGKVYKLYENGVLIDTQSLDEKTPQAQVAVTSISGRELGTYNYYCEFINDSGVTTSNTMTIKVIK